MTVAGYYKSEEGNGDDDSDDDNEGRYLKLRRTRTWVILLYPLWAWTRTLLHKTLWQAVDHNKNGFLSNRQDRDRGNKDYRDDHDVARAIMVLGYISQRDDWSMKMRWVAPVKGSNEASLFGSTQSGSSTDSGGIRRRSPQLEGGHSVYIRGWGTKKGHG